MNVLLNTAHTFLYRWCQLAARAAGLLPGVGVLHRPRAGHAALASDLQEPFRHLMDRAVLDVLTRLRPADFRKTPGGRFNLTILPRAAQEVAATAVLPGPRARPGARRPGRPVDGLHAPGGRRAVSWYVAAYDIADDRRRDRVARVLLDFGRRVQQSVFEVWLNPDDVPALRRRLGPLLAKTDLFDLFPVDTRRPEARVSWQRPPRPPEVTFAGPFPPATESDPDSESGPLSDELPIGYDADSTGGCGTAQPSNDPPPVDR